MVVERRSGDRGSGGNRGRKWGQKAQEWANREKRQQREWATERVNNTGNAQQREWGKRITEREWNKKVVEGVGTEGRGKTEGVGNRESGKSKRAQRECNIGSGKRWSGKQRECDRVSGVQREWERRGGKGVGKQREWQQKEGGNRGSKQQREWEKREWVVNRGVATQGRGIVAAGNIASAGHRPIVPI